jgi:ferredoxin
MRYCLYYFSGTLNTERIANLFKKELGGEGEAYRLFYPFSSYPNPREYDLLGFGYPIHAFNTPKVVLDFVRRLPKGHHQPFFIFKDSGEPIAMNDASSMTLIHLLKKKGYYCIQEFHYLMPYNIVFRHSDLMTKKMWIYAQKMVAFNAKKLADGIQEKPKAHPFVFALSLPFRIEWPFAKTNGRHFKVDEAKCIHCFRCVQSCPEQNITYENRKFHFGNRCALCLNCSFLCPEKAITPGLFRHHWFLNGAYPFETLEKDPNIIVSEKNHEKLYNRAYHHYFAKCDELIKTSQADK